MTKRLDSRHAVAGRGCNDHLTVEGSKDVLHHDEATAWFSREFTQSAFDLDDIMNRSCDRHHKKMMAPMPRTYGEMLVKGAPQGSYPFFFSLRGAPQGSYPFFFSLRVNMIAARVTPDAISLSSCDHVLCAVRTNW